MNSPEVKEFIRQHREPFWYIPEDKKEDVIREAIKNFGQLFSEKLLREQLTFHKDINYSGPVEYIVPAPSDEEIRQFLIDIAINLEF